MSLGLSLSKSYRELQQSWTRFADSVFGRALPGAHDEMSRGEFTSAFICDSAPASERRPESRR